MLDHNRERCTIFNRVCTEAVADKNKDRSWYYIDSQYNTNGICICYGVYSRDSHIIKALDEQVKDKLWAMIVEKSILTQKKILLVEDNSEYIENDDNVLTYTPKKLLKDYPTSTDIIDRILVLFVELGKANSVLFYANSTRNNLYRQFAGWEIFFNKDFTVLNSILTQMHTENLLHVDFGKEGLNCYISTITIKGVERHKGLASELDTKKCFVAMKFGKGDDGRNMNDFMNEVIRPAVAETGYEAQIVSDSDNGYKICDKIIADIRRAKFVIVDLTHGNNGAYYEAGFAHALNKPVIFICEEKWFCDGSYSNRSKPENRYKIKNKGTPNGVHFDINHYPVIVYKNDSEGLEKLKEEIKNRIKARVQ